MRRSEFDRAVSDEFGARAGAVVDDLVLAPLGGKTPREALNEGVPPRLIWEAVCAEMDVPDDRRYGVGRIEPKKA
jgi:hypothetical protein